MAKGFMITDKHVKLLPILTIAAALSGAIYNLGIVTAFGADLFYLFSYSDHLNSALVAFLGLGFGILCLEVIYFLLFRGRSQFDHSISNALAAITQIILIIMFFLLYTKGVLSFAAFSNVLAFVGVFSSVFFLRRYVLSAHSVALCLGIVFLFAVSFWLGLDWIAQARLRTDVRAIVVTNDMIISAKGVKPFTTFSLLVDEKNALIVVKTIDIKKIEPQQMKRL